MFYLNQEFRLSSLPFLYLF